MRGFDIKKTEEREQVKISWGGGEELACLLSLSFSSSVDTLMRWWTLFLLPGLGLFSSYFCATPWCPSPSVKANSPSYFSLFSSVIVFPPYSQNCVSIYTHSTERTCWVVVQQLLFFPLSLYPRLVSLQNFSFTLIDTKPGVRSTASGSGSK